MSPPLAVPSTTPPCQSRRVGRHRLAEGGTLPGGALLIEKMSLSTVKGMADSVIASAQRRHARAMLD